MDRNETALKVVKLEKDLQDIKGFFGWLLNNPLKNLDGMIQELDMRQQAIKELSVDHGVFDFDKFSNKLESIREEYKEQTDKFVKDTAAGNQENKADEEQK